MDQSNLDLRDFDLKDIDRSIDLATYIDHTLLEPTAIPAAIQDLCDAADQYHFATVCVAPTYVPLAVERLHHKRPQVCTVIGFPSGAHTSSVKLLEAQIATEQGAQELDVVINLGWLKAGQAEQVHGEIASIVSSTGVTVKAILEMAVLTEAEKRLAAELCLDAGVAWLKTSTGWFGGATVADVKLLKSITLDRIGIKASGGIRTLDQALALIAAGASRLGTSRGVELIRQRNELG
jgi:deoxyribose-phosphate aldolase